MRGPYLNKHDSTVGSILGSLDLWNPLSVDTTVSPTVSHKLSQHFSGQGATHQYVRCLRFASTILHVQFRVAGLGCTTIEASVSCNRFRLFELLGL